MKKILYKTLGIYVYLIGPFDVSKLGNEIVNLLAKGSNIVTTDGVLEGNGGAPAMEDNKSLIIVIYKVYIVLTNYSNLNRL